MEDSIIDDAVALKIAPGDVIALFTDGFYEWMNAAGEQFGLKRLKNVVSQNRHDTAQVILDRMTESVRTFAGDTPQPDDMTAVVIKREATRRS